MSRFFVVLLGLFVLSNGLKCPEKKFNFVPDDADPPLVECPSNVTYCFKTILDMNKDELWPKRYNLFIYGCDVAAECAGFLNGRPEGCYDGVIREHLAELPLLQGLLGLKVCCKTGEFPRMSPYEYY